MNLLAIILALFIAGPAAAQSLSGQMSIGGGAVNEPTTSTQALASLTVNNQIKLTSMTTTGSILSIDPNGLVIQNTGFTYDSSNHTENITANQNASAYRCNSDGCLYQAQTVRPAWWVSTNAGNYMCGGGSPNQNQGALGDCANPGFGVMTNKALTWDQSQMVTIPARLTVFNMDGGTAISSAAVALIGAMDVANVFQTGGQTNLVGSTFTANGQITASSMTLKGTISAKGPTNFPGIAFSSTAITGTVAATSGYTCQTGSTIPWISNGNYATVLLGSDAANTNLGAATGATVLLDGNILGTTFFAYFREFVISFGGAFVGVYHFKTTAGAHQLCLSMIVTAGTTTLGAQTPSEFSVTEY